MTVPGLDSSEDLQVVEGERTAFRPSDDAELVLANPDRPRPQWRTVVSRFVGDRGALLALIVLALLAVVSFGASFIAPYDPNAQDFSATLQPPTASHWFGTDDLGRDVFSRMLHGGRLSIGAAMISVSVGAAIGILPGLLAGFRGGFIDLTLSRVVDAAMCIPGLILSIALVTVLGPGIYQVAVAVGVSFGPRFYRVARGSAIAVGSETFIKAARASGCRETRILLRHVVPNVLPVIIVQGSLMFGFGLLAETGLSYLGLGAQPPEASWGSLLRRGSQYLMEAQHLAVIPGLTIAVAVLAANLAGDGLQGALGVVRRKGKV